MIQKAEGTFRTNREEIQYLHKYFLGEQPILQRTKEVRDDINNTPVENHYQEIVNFYTGYIAGKPWVYVRDGGENDVSEDVQALNKMMSYEGKTSSDRILMQWMCECGLGYRIIVPDKMFIEGEVDEAPFILDNINSDMAYVIRNSGVGHRVLAGVMHVPRDSGTELICVYTPNEYYEIDNNEIVRRESHTLGLVPIIEYELNPERMAAPEPVLTLLEELNNMAANRYDGIEQVVQSFMKFVNCDIDEDKFEKLKQRGAIAIKSTTNAPADVDILTTDLDQTQSQVLVDYTLGQICAISGMPKVGNAEAATSDNVGAVIVRNGWNQTEARAQQIEAMIRKSEREFLKVALTIINTTTNSDLHLSDIDIRFPRREYDNLQSKAQVFTTLIQSGAAPELAFALCGMFPDPQSAFEMSKPYLAAKKLYLEEGSSTPVKEDPTDPEDPTDNKAPNQAEPAA